MRQYLFIIRHAVDELDAEWDKANNDHRVLGVPGRGLEKDIPAIEAALAEYAVLVRSIISDLIMSRDLCLGPLISYCSQKLRARQSAAALREYMSEHLRGVAMQATQYNEGLDGRNYGFTWHRTVSGIIKLLRQLLLEREQEKESEDYQSLLQEYERLLKDPDTFCPWGGETPSEFASRVTSFIKHKVLPAHQNIFLMTHQETAPIIEDCLRGLPPKVTADRPRLPNATAKIWIRDWSNHERPGTWKWYKNISGRLKQDYSSDCCHVPSLQPPWSGVVDLNEYRKHRQEIKRRYHVV